jgi:hypothetical protein
MVEVNYRYTVIVRVGVRVGGCVVDAECFSLESQAL